MLQIVRVFTNVQVLHDFCVMQDLSPYQQAHKLVQMPSLLEWLSFVFASGNLLAGPYFELADYLNFIQKKGPWDPRSKQPSDASQYRAGVSYVPIVFTCENSLIWARCTIRLMFYDPLCHRPCDL